MSKDLKQMMQRICVVEGMDHAVVDELDGDVDVFLINLFRHENEDKK